MKASTLIKIAVAVPIIAALAITVHNFGKIEKNPENTIGNNAGNLLNDGLICEFENKVYFHNAADNGSLWKMNINETGFEKLSPSRVKFLNIAGKHIYYYEAGDNNSGVLSFMGHQMGIYRTNMDGKRPLCLQQSPTDNLTLVGNTVYYEYFATKHNGDKEDKGLGFYCINTDRQGRKQLSDDPVIPANYYNNEFYYAGQVKDHNLHAFNPKTKADRVIFSGNFWNPQISGQYVYYMNPDDGYTLYRRPLSGGAEEKLTDVWVDCFNVVKDTWIFYQTNDGGDSGLMRMYTDGSNKEIIMTGRYKSINASSKYVYFLSFDNNRMMFHQEIDGLAGGSVFNPK